MEKTSRRRQRLPIAQLRLDRGEPSEETVNRHGRHYARREIFRRIRILSSLLKSAAHF
jgi:hypothetical protein